MPEAAFKAFRAHASRYPGCDAKNVVLTDTEKNARGDKRKGKSTVTLVVISAEAVQAFHECREEPLPEETITAIRFCDERCEKFGAPKGLRPLNGFQRIDFTMQSCWSGQRTHWRLTEDDKRTADPDCSWSAAELKEQKEEQERLREKIRRIQE
jgi:hypothetical protein